MESRFVMAVDVGQAHDYTAVSILHSWPTREKVGEWPNEKVVEDRRHDLVHLERFRDISYPEQIRRVQERYADLERHAETLAGEPSVSLVVDATGVGKPILDAFREAKLRPRGVIITGGETSSHADGLDRVPKRELVTTLQVALQSKRLRIAEELPLAELLLKEFRGFKVQITLSGHARFGNDVGQWREADHDDLVLATALAVWLMEARKTTSTRVLHALAGLNI
jgi:hypothetical protein